MKPASDLEADDGAPRVASRRKTLANCQLQYQALEARMLPFPGTRFIVWTGSARVAPLLGRRIVDVIEGRGDTASPTGQ